MRTTVSGRTGRRRSFVGSLGVLGLSVALAACGSGRTDSGSTSSATSSSTDSATSSSTSAPATSGVTSSSASATAAGSGASGTPAASSGATATAGNSSASTPTGPAIKIGTTDKVVALDPAGAYDNGSQLLETQLYQYLVFVAPGQKTPTPDAAQKCDFGAGGSTYVCTIKPGLKFSNGDPLTAADVAFSFNRVVKINDPNGPSSLLANMKSVAATDASTVTFTLINPNDQTFPFILGTSAGPIVDSKVFPADKLLDDAKVIGSGPYKLGDGYQKNQLAALVPNSSYAGNGGAVKNSGVTLTYYTDASNLKLAVQQGEVDVAWRSLDAQSISDLRSDSSVKVLDGPGGELRYLVFNFKTMAGGSDAGKLAVRRAVAESVDRTALATIYQNLYTPAYSMVPSGLPGEVDSFKDEFGAAPDKAKAAAELSKAGVSTPVQLSIQYAPDHYGPGSADEYGEIKRQLEATGLFKVSIQSTEYTTYSKQRVADAYPEYQLGWFPDFPDADNYLQPFLVQGNFIGAHYCDDPKKFPDAKVGSRPCDLDKVAPLLTTEETTSGDGRTAALQQIQKLQASGQLATLPLLQGKQIAVTGPTVTGVQDTLDTAFLFRFWVISKSS